MTSKFDPLVKRDLMMSTLGIDLPWVDRLRSLHLPALPSVNAIAIAPPNLHMQRCRRPSMNWKLRWRRSLGTMSPLWINWSNCSIEQTSNLWGSNSSKTKKKHIRLSYHHWWHDVILFIDVCRFYDGHMYCYTQFEASCWSVSTSLQRCTDSGTDFEDLWGSVVDNRE